MSQPAAEGDREWIGLARQLGVPDELALVYEFLNSIDQRRFVYQGYHHVGRDELLSPDALQVWLVNRGLLSSEHHVSEAQLEIALELRALLRKRLENVAQQPNDVGSDEASQVFAQLPILVRTDGGVPTFNPATSGVIGGLTAILIAAALAAAAGSWTRLKMCGASDCRWVFYDHSRSRTGRWCETAICGNRAKTTAYRRRKSTKEQAY